VVCLRPARAATGPGIGRGAALLAANSVPWTGGTMADIAGYPLAGLSVAFLGTSIGLAFWLDAATYVVSAEFPEKTAAAVTVATADPVARPRPDQLVLDLEGCRSRLSGSIVDASGGGIAKARLTVAGLGGTEATTAGEYSLCVPLGDSVVRIVADGYGALELPIHLVGQLHRDFELVPEAVLTGVVVDEAGKTIADARVIAVPQAVEQPHFLGKGATFTDADGRFRLENLAPGRFMLAASAEGLGTSAPRPAVAAPGTAAEITLVVSTRARVAGRVVMKGNAVEGARISVVRAGLLARASYSQADGSFVLEGVPLGTVKLDAGDYEIVKPRELVVGAATLENVEIEVSELATLRGKVSRQGPPAADAPVATFTGPNGLQARTDEAGNYELRGIRGTSVTAYAQTFGDAPSFAPVETVKLAAGGVTTHDFELSGAAMVSGTVVDEAGNPVPNVYVRMIDGNGDLGESMTDATGAFLCTSMLGGGPYRPAVFPTPGSRTAFPPASPAAYAPINLVNGDAFVKNVTIAIKNNRLAISGRVVDAGGQPVADVHVEAIGRGFGGNPAMLPSVRADVSGAFTPGDLPPGGYALPAPPRDRSEGQGPRHAPGPAGVELRLVRPGSVEGTLVGFTTEPRVHARQITAQLSIGNEAVVEGNRFSITGLTPGRYVVEALGNEGSDGLSVTVKAGTVTTVVLTSKAKGSLAGTVVDFASGAPLPGMSCAAAQSLGGQAGDLGPDAPSTTSDARGRFTLAAPIGKARVMCFPPDASYSVAGVDVDVPATGQGTFTLAAVKAVPPPSDVGYRLKPLTLPLVIASVDADGPAKQGGLAVGDILVSVDGTSVAGLIPSGAMVLAWNHRPGTTMTLGVERNGAPVSVKILVAAPQD